MTGAWFFPFALSNLAITRFYKIFQHDIEIDIGDWWRWFSGLAFV
jgi:hypothetical protein